MDEAPRGSTVFLLTEHAWRDFVAGWTIETAPPPLALGGWDASHETIWLED